MESEDFYTVNKCDISGKIPPLPSKTVYAMAYVPFQQYSTIYSSEQALESGTLFPELDKPFCAYKGYRGDKR